MNEPVRVTRANDYATLEGGRFEFYYGYEFDHDDEGEVWGFSVTCAGHVVFRISHQEMTAYRGHPGIFETQDCLLFGIGLYFVGGPDE